MLRRVQLRQGRKCTINLFPAPRLLAATRNLPELVHRATPGTESDEARRIRAWLTVIESEDWLCEWTAGFVADLLRRRSLDGLSFKQTECVNRIIRQAHDRGVRVRRAA